MSASDVHQLTGKRLAHEQEVCYLNLQDLTVSLSLVLPKGQR